MIKKVVLLSTLLLISCATKKEHKSDQPVLHNGQCTSAGKVINCTWHDVAISNQKAN